MKSGVFSFIVSWHFCDVLVIFYFKGGRSDKETRGKIGRISSQESREDGKISAGLFCTKIVVFLWVANEVKGHSFDSFLRSYPFLIIRLSDHREIAKTAKKSRKMKKKTKKISTPYWTPRKKKRKKKWKTKKKKLKRMRSSVSKQRLEIDTMKRLAEYLLFRSVITEWFGLFHLKVFLFH